MKARWLGKEQLDHWDRNAPLPEEDTRVVPWAEAKETVLRAYSSFDRRMSDIALLFFDKHWIDAPVRKGKTPGAFSHPTVPSVHPYVLLNYQGKTRDVMTLAHELGHGVHQVLAAAQGPLLSRTPLTLAETASVFGEMLTFQSLLKDTTDARKRKSLLAQKVEDMLNTVVRQTAFYAFERKVHTERKSGELTADRLGELWLEVQGESLGPAMRLGPGYETFWCYIPHFVHSPFYVYAYAFGDCLVNSLFARYREASDGFVGEVLHHARGRRNEASQGAARAIRARCLRAVILGARARHDRGLHRRDRTSRPGETLSERGRDGEPNRLSARVQRYANVGAGLGTAAARVAAGRVLGSGASTADEARMFRDALGSLKGPLMKVAQLLSTIPDVLPPEYSRELSELQAQAPAMGWPFVRRRMAAELGADWQNRFQSFEPAAAAAASLGQVHRALHPDGSKLACKLQYPDMNSAVEADLAQLNLLLSLHRRMDPAIDAREIGEEIGARLREELDYGREARHMALYQAMLDGEPLVRVPCIFAELSTRRLLTMSWLDGEQLLNFKTAPLEQRNLIAHSLFTAWWRPFCRFGVIHGDPHLGNYTVFREEREPQGINLLDYGCVRIFPALFVAGVVDLYEGLQRNDRAQIAHAYETWGFKDLDAELIDILNIWARFIYGPLMDDKVRAIAGDASPAEYGRKQAFKVHRALKEKGPVSIPREFVFMDRAAIGLGGVFIHLRAELNFHRLFNDALADFSRSRVEQAQRQALGAAGL